MATSSRSTGTMAAPATEREIVIMRTFDAPRELVFEAFTDAGHVSNWWGPNGFTTTTQEMDVRPGGVWRHVMRGPDGTDYPNFIRYEEVKRPELLSWAHGSAEGEPADFHASVTFVERDGGTEVTLRSVFPTKEARDRTVKEYGAREGAKQTLARFAEHLDQVIEVRRGTSFLMISEREQLSARAFEAPRHVVFDAMTQCQHVRNWYGPRTHTMKHCAIDLRPGGHYRYVLSTPDGQEYAFAGVYREIVRPERLVNTWYWEAMPDRGTLETGTFHERAGRTVAVLRAEFKSAEDYQGWAASGGMEGMAETLERLAELVRGA